LTRIYANLLGNWVDITDGTVADGLHTGTYFKEMLGYEGGSKIAKPFEFGYINVQYDEKNYRIDPSCIQIVTSQI